MPEKTAPIRVLVHADESCLGNGMEPPNPGGNAALIEAPAGDSVARWDFYECSPDTTNNRMALSGAIATLEWLHRQWRSARVTYVSDSEYLIKGMNQWVPGWVARGWRRKGGAVENLPLWQKLVQAAAGHAVEGRGGGGHKDKPQKEDAHDPAVPAAERPERPHGPVASRLAPWAGPPRGRGPYTPSR